MSLQAALKVPKCGFFYFEYDCIISVVPIKKMSTVIGGDNVSKGKQGHAELW